MTSSQDSSRYAETHAAWARNPEAFWLEAARGIDWATPPARAFDANAGVYGRWFPDGVLNTCFNAVDRHVLAGHGDRVALIHDSPVTGSNGRPAIRRMTYAELQAETVALGAVLTEMGVAKGDRVVISMPMTLEAVVAMLACARVGAVHSVVFGGFAAAELAKRIEDATPKAILTASCGLEPARVVAYKPLIDGAIEFSAHKPNAVLVFQRPQVEAALTPDRDRDWAEAVADAKARALPCEPVAVAATDPLYVLYTSGTTGRPKGIVRDNGGHAVALRWATENHFGIRAGDVFFTASDVGWVVGHSFIVYGPLLAGATSVVFEGKPVGTPDAGTYWRVIAEHGVKCFFTAPTAIRAVRKEDPEAKLLAGRDLSRFEALFLAGERADPETVIWAQEVLQRPVLDHWWQTETGWPIAGNPKGLGLLPVKIGSPTVPMPGWDLRVLDEGGREVEPGAMGTLAAKLPLPPGALPTLWNDDARFRASYLEAFPGFYTTSDAGMIDADGYVYVMGRTDDVINVAGHRLSTGGMEEVLAAHPAVAECAVIGARDDLKGEVPCGFVVLKNGVDLPPAAVEAECVALVRERVGPVAAFRRAVVVKRLPKTRSGKILRGTMKRIADGDEWSAPATIDDPAILDEIAAALKG